MEERPFSDISYHQFLSEEKIMGSKCKKCGALYAPPRPICIKCRGIEMQWVEMRGKGKLVAFTCIAVVTPVMTKAGYDKQHPYVVGVVELEEGVKVDAHIKGIDGTKPEAIKIGTPLVVEFPHSSKGKDSQIILTFRPL
ncbi:Zn-ribbon domain-containing OB-fold protein [Chloroflexota bacterium]